MTKLIDSNGFSGVDRQWLNGLSCIYSAGAIDRAFDLLHGRYDAEAPNKQLPFTPIVDEPAVENILDFQVAIQHHLHVNSLYLDTLRQHVERIGGYENLGDYLPWNPDAHKNWLQYQSCLANERNGRGPLYYGTGFEG